MGKQFLAVTGLVGLLLAVGMVAADAGGKGGGLSGNPSTGSPPPGFSSGGQRNGWDNAKQPPGWGKGQKEGWERGTGGTTTVPPGLRGH
jgi:hypothetical protein